MIVGAFFVLDSSESSVSFWRFVFSESQIPFTMRERERETLLLDKKDRNPNSCWWRNFLSCFCCLGSLSIFEKRTQQQQMGINCLLLFAGRERERERDFTMRQKWFLPFLPHFSSWETRCSQNASPDFFAEAKLWLQKVRSCNQTTGKEARLSRGSRKEKKSCKSLSASALWVTTFVGEKPDNCCVVQRWYYPYNKRIVEDTLRNSKKCWERLSM